MSLVETEPHRSLPAIAAHDLFSDPATFEHAQRVAKVYASSSLVPKHMQGNVADCLIALQIARRLNEEPLTVLQNIYIVSGRPGWTTAYVIARARRSGVFKGPVTWRTAGAGDTLAVTAVGVLADTGEEVAVTADMRMAKAEGWTKNAKYVSMPEHMLRWRSAAMLIRLYAPEVMIGLPVVEEVETAGVQELRDVTPPKDAAAALDAFAAGAAEAAARRDAEDVQEQPEGAGEASPPAEAKAEPAEQAAKPAAARKEAKAAPAKEEPKAAAVATPKPLTEAEIATLREFNAEMARHTEFKPLREASVAFWESRPDKRFVVQDAERAIYQAHSRRIAGELDEEEVAIRVEDALTPRPASEKAAA